MICWLENQQDQTSRVGWDDHESMLIEGTICKVLRRTMVDLGASDESRVNSSEGPSEGHMGGIQRNRGDIFKSLSLRITPIFSLSSPSYSPFSLYSFLYPLLRPPMFFPTIPQTALILSFLVNLQPKNSSPRTLIQTLPRNLTNKEP